MNQSYHSPSLSCRLDLQAGPRAKQYHRRKLWLGAAGLVVELLFLWGLIASGLSAALGGWAEGLGWGGPWVAVAAYLTVFGVLNEIVSFPTSFLRGFKLERHYGLSHESLGGWMKDHAKAVGLNALFTLLLVEILYAFIRGGGAQWWIWSGLVFCLIFIVVARLAPVVIFPLFFTFTPVGEGELRDRIEALARRAGAMVAGIFEMDLSRKSRAVNAALAGMGRTRRIILADTLLQRFSLDEVEIVIAHELGHHQHHDLLKGMALQSGMVFLFLFLVDALAGGWAEGLGFERGLADVAALPLLGLTGTVLGVVLMPIVCTAMRRFEREADRFAIELTGRPEAFASAMRRLASFNMADPSPNRLIELFFHSHPSIRRRLEFCEALREGLPDDGEGMGKE